MDKQLKNRECTWASISGHANLSIAIGISSLHGVEFPMFSVALLVLSEVRGGNGREFCATVGAFV